MMVSKALVVGAYQRKLEELARLPDIGLVAIVPPRWSDRDAPVPLERAHTAGYELVVAPLILNGQYHLHFYPTLGRLLRRWQPDILHMDEEPYNLATWHALRVAQSVGARSLFFTWQNLARRYPWPFRRFELSNYHRAAHAIAGNQTAAAVIRAKGYTGPLSVIPQFGIDPDVFRPLPGRKDQQPNESSGRPCRFVVGYAGRLVPEKGIEVLLRACAALSFRDWSLCLLGDGPDRVRLTDLAQALGVADQVTFLGRVPSIEIPDYYRRLDVFVLPSLTRPNWAEQFGRVLIEAMACGVPVIGSSGGEIPQVIGDAGLIVPEGDVEALSEAITALSTDQARRAELAVQGRARVLAQFTHAQVAAATAQVYREMWYN